MTPVAAAPSRVQVTVVAGPPVETQVRVNTGGSAETADTRLNSSGSVMVGSPKLRVKYFILVLIGRYFSVAKLTLWCP